VTVTHVKYYRNHCFILFEKLPIILPKNNDGFGLLILK